MSENKRKAESLDDRRVSEHTRDLLKKAGYKVVQKTKEVHRAWRFRKKREIKKKGLQNLDITLDYSSLQYLGVIRPFIQKKFNVTYSELELLLFLVPLGIWSVEDYQEFPHRYSTRTIKSVFNKGFCYAMFDKYAFNSKYQTYNTTKQAKRIVRDFYEYLHMEKTIPESPNRNPLMRADVSPRDQVKAKAIMKLNQKIRKNNKVTPEHEKLNNRIIKRVMSTPEEDKQKTNDLFEKIERAKKLKKLEEEIIKEDSHKKSLH